MGLLDDIELILLEALFDWLNNQARNAASAYGRAVTLLNAAIDPSGFKASGSSSAMTHFHTPQR